MFELRIADQRINAFRVVKGQTREDVQAKAEAQIAKWNEIAARKLEQSRLQARREAAYFDAAEGARQAELLTQEATLNIAALERLLPNLSQAAVPTWSALKDRTLFTELAPTAPKLADLPTSPSQESFAPTLTFLDRMISSRRAAKEQAASGEFETSLVNWRNRKAGVEQTNRQADERHKQASAAWQKRREEHLSKQKSFNANIDLLRDEYTRGTADGIEFVIGEMLLRTPFPSGFPQGTNMSYLEEGKVLILDMDFPNQDVIPVLRDAKYVKVKSQLATRATTDAWRKATYDSLLYQLALGVIQRVFRIDDKTWIHSVVLNGWVQSIDKSTGADARGCLLSLQVGRDEFMPLDLSRVDPKACFRSLKGVASSRLSEMTPIKPI